MRTTLFRSLFNIAKRFKAASLLNVLALAFAFLAFMVIMMQIHYDWCFDSDQKAADRIMRFDIVWENNESQSVICRPLSILFTQFSPQIEAGCILEPSTPEELYGIRNDESETRYKETTRKASPAVTEVFDFDWLEGGTENLNEPNSILIPGSMAKRMFGNQPALNQALFIHDGNMQDQNLVIKGVYADFQPNATLGNVIYEMLPETKNADKWNNWSYYYFVRMTKDADAEAIVDNFLNTSRANESLWGYIANPNCTARLTPLTSLHFLNGVSYDFLPKANRQTLLVLLSIAFIILIIAGINYTNFNTALVPMRIKNINTQKVLGSTDAMLRRSLISEAFVVSLLAYGISLLLLWWFQHSRLIQLIDADPAFSAQKWIIIGTAGIAVLLGLCAGLYPAYYAVSFPPALVLKGRFGLSDRGRRLRNVLIGIQFFASFALIICALFMYLQNHYMLNQPLGFDKDQVIVTNLSPRVNFNQERFVNELKGHSAISQVAFSEFLLSGQNGYSGWGREYKNKEINFQCLPVSPEFLEVMGIEVTDGRSFRQDDNRLETGSYIFNEKARVMYDMALGDKIYDDQIIGFIPDVHISTFKEEIAPMSFFVWGKYRWGSENDYTYPYAYIKVPAGQDLHAAMLQVQNTLHAIDPVYPFQPRFYDEVLQRTYQKELNSGFLISIFSLIAIFISIVGVFGLVVFESEYRSKEIALRKIMGSTTRDILIMFNRNYVVILLICFVGSAPIAWYIIHQWLQNFAYHIPMYWWVFPFAFLLVSFITVLTVTYQNWRIANANPVMNLKRE